MTIPTVYDVLIKLEPSMAEPGSVSAADFMRHGLSWYGGCSVCQASISAGNACMGRDGNLVGTCCANDENALSLNEIIADRMERRIDTVEVIATRLQNTIHRLLIAREDLNALSHDRAGVWTRPDSDAHAEAFDDAWQRFADALGELGGGP